MGVFGRFEKKVEGAVSEAFARAFKGDVQPVEIAARLQRELDGEAKLVSRDKWLVPNEFTVTLSQHDHDKLTPYGPSLTADLVAELKDHAGERSYHFAGPIKIHFALDPALPTGRFRLAAQAVPGVEVPPPPRERPVTAQPIPAPPTPAVPERSQRAKVPKPQPLQRQAPPPGPQQSTPSSTGWEPSPGPASSAAQGPAGSLVLEVNGLRHPLVPPGITIGRGMDADLRINDPGISRLHAEIRVTGVGASQRIEIIDLGSTNGILVNGERVRTGPLTSGTRIQIGSTRMLVYTPSGG